MTGVSGISSNNKHRNKDLEVLLFTIDTLASATNNFSLNNILGEGGFGHVYKVLNYYLPCKFYATSYYDSPLNRSQKTKYYLVAYDNQGTLKDGLEIAVKRLSKSSRQGLDEFKNEVRHIVNLQHRNLVKLLGCCIEGEEKMLIYEFLPNKSLDFFIFGLDL